MTRLAKKHSSGVVCTWETHRELFRTPEIERGDDELAYWLPLLDSLSRNEEALKHILPINRFVRYPLFRLYSSYHFINGCYYFSNVCQVLKSPILDFIEHSQCFFPCLNLIPKDILN